ncbi:MAG: tetratricopeptide repeat protein [Steroidobacteraceae bacterium]
MSILVLVLVAACQSEPRADSPAAREISPPAAAAAPASAAAAANAAAPANAAAAAGAPSAVPVPTEAARQYADALNLVRAGRSSDAELEFKGLTVAYPEFAGPQMNLGLLYMQSSRLPEAEAAFKAALERNPASAVAGNELGIVERKLGKFTEAEAAYQRTIATEPNYAPAYLNLGVLYDLYLAEPQKALEQFEHYIQIAGENKRVAGWVVELRKRVGASAPAAKKEAS